ncbi:type II toxin-antitoxin system RelE/ParE family toxin [Bdellovibrio bacteriovorus]|uniref:Plasmid maintenance system killer protein n=1 Tax=Bdellovibrio bacteriovorus (strain ATCC 15356 / DSM 50701 / NCIMB 9529 / HD100) TaxID=264462 RepID=Q6MNG1_BDEBA|nr:type II toxin-antitoxin system RelE/ParE family toxin [Bdellovibrio bacteriovorus]CAE79191.1 hypothetical protein predicted by Glimmer/Critica [Bdellovibrio bacteriovorus HD100]
MIHEVRLSKKAKADLLKVPKHIVVKFRLWVLSIEKVGLAEARKSPALHDEPLKGSRVGQRSIRLNKAYRAIYTLRADGAVEFLEVLEVNKHEY